MRTQPGGIGDKGAKNTIEDKRNNSKLIISVEVLEVMVPCWYTPEK